MFKFLAKYRSRNVPALPRRANRGFTLVEMVITVAVMAILIGISTPSIFEFMRQRDYQNEEIAMGEVRKALQAYLADVGELPTDTGTGVNLWYNLLAGYTSMSANEIANDVWGRPRRYVVYINTDRKMFGNTVNVYYATVHSAGVNGIAENFYLDSSSNKVPIAGIALNGKDFATTSGSTDWWKFLGTTATDKINAYSALRPGGDDKLMRFTNYAEVLDRYNATIQRLDRLTQALETSARSGYASRVSLCSGSNPDATLCGNGIPEKTIYYPRSKPKEGTDAATVQYSDSTILVDNTANDATRRNGMVALMNRLGLPAEFCCSAMETSTLDKLPLPFYYFSNPRARNTNGCDPRPDINGAKLPARITTKYSGESNSDRTCG